MYMVVFALMIAVSGWVAWRNNPMFSVRSTLRFFLAVGLMLAVFIGVMIKAAEFSTEHPGPPGFIAIGATILFGTIAMIWVVVAVSTPKSTPLPASANVVHLYRGKLRVWVRRYAVAVALFAVLEVVLPGTPRIIVGTVGGIFVFLGIVLLFTAYISARQMDLWLSAVEANPWVHWQYSPEQWKQWTDVQVARTSSTPTFQWHRDWPKAAWPVLLVAIGVGVFAPGTVLEKSLYVGGIAALLVLLATLGQHSDKHAPQRVHAALANSQPEVYLGYEGLFCDGVFTPWLSSGVYLLAASVDPNAPRSLVLTFNKIVPGYTGNTPTNLAFSMPLPTGSSVSEDLAHLQQQLSARCPTATINIV